MMFTYLFKKIFLQPFAISLFRILSYPLPYRVALVRLLSLLFPRFRPHYYSCIFEAATLAKKLRYQTISIIEFGVAGGNGMLAIERYSRKISKMVDIDIEVYGFDRGGKTPGLPPAKDYRDLPHIWQEGFYPMEEAELREKLSFSKLIVGDVSETCDTFIDKFHPPPIACIFFDLDYYSSTVSAFRLFESPSNHYLPRVYCCFDNVQPPVHEFVGELLAINEFNKTHSLKKIAKNNSLADNYLFGAWAEHVYVFHDFEHEKYNDFVVEAVVELPLR